MVKWESIVTLLLERRFLSAVPITVGENGFLRGVSFLLQEALEGPLDLQPRAVPQRRGDRNNQDGERQSDGFRFGEEAMHRGVHRPVGDLPLLGHHAAAAGVQPPPRGGGGHHSSVRTDNEIQEVRVLPD